MFKFIYDEQRSLPLGPWFFRVRTLLVVLCLFQLNNAPN